MKCSICGYRIERLGTCQRTGKYDKKSGRFNVGKVTHEGCALKHWDTHHNPRNPRSLAATAQSVPFAKGRPA